MLINFNIYMKTEIEWLAMQQMKMWTWAGCQSIIEEFLEENIVSCNLVRDELEDAY